jgi:hypothetical protein
MEDDAVFLQHLKSIKPDAELSDLQADLELAKQSSTYKESVDAQRKGFIKGKAEQKQAADEAAQNAINANLDNERRIVVKAVAEMTEVAGWTLDDKGKNTVLETLLEVDDAGESPFIKEIFTDPAKLFKAAWLFQYGEEKFDMMANNYQKKINEAFLKGKATVLGTTPASISRVKGKEDIDDVITRREQSQARTLDELHAEE